MEIYEKTVEVLEPEVTKLMKFMYFQVRGACIHSEGSQRPPTVHILDFGAMSFFFIGLVFLRATYSPMGEPGQQVSPPPQRMCPPSEYVYAWSTEL